ncbi:UNVERIFIED_CONTAM: putative late blight resistance proteinR1B-16 [Sesamum radiatum]|uniref:Late blight resistance proteinR1B-16 n=1 Tax=Sesamum radiatum TaxID=300843 RepID=A0AAW2PJK8_SESRA
MELKHRLTGWESKLQVIPITGMGGAGKTTLARNLYDDSLVKDHFDVRAWVTISQTYIVEDVIGGLLADFGVVIDKVKEKSVQVLTQILWKNLKGRRYIIVLDDMWSTEVWDDMKRIFPDDGNGSRIMLTTRLQGVAVYATDSFSPPHRISLLDEDKSWYLLCQAVFGQEGCPPEFQELEDIGKMIARNCNGLPLATSVVGGLLANSAMTREFWGYVADNVNSIAIEHEEHCSEILSLSNKHLPHHLKPCFLYFGAFPEDYKIPVTKLIRLWIAEGFLRPSRSKSLEAVAEGYLNDLIDRNLVIVCRRGSNGKTRTCTMYDLLRDLCIKEAQNENFFHIINRFAQFSPQDMNNIPRRLIMHPDIPEGSDINECMESMTLTRSLLCTGCVLPTLPFYQNFRFLRVLDFLKAEFSKFPFDFRFLVNLSFPESLKKLTLIGSMLSWKDMSIIGSLPHLEVLKLKEYSFTGAVWEPVEGEFSRLKFLLIERLDLVRWIAENTHFPCLEHLIISDCMDLEAIPSGIGDIATLKVIDIDETTPALLLWRQSSRFWRSSETWRIMSFKLLYVPIRSVCKDRKKSCRTLHIFIINDGDYIHNRSCN